MEDRVKLVVHGERGYFLVRKSQKKFSLPSGGVRKHEDFKDVAYKILNKALGTFGSIAGIVRIQREYKDESSSSALSVVFLIEVSGDCVPLLDIEQKWFAEDELSRSQSAMEPTTLTILETVAEKRKKREAFCPCEVLECVIPRGKASDKWQVGAMKPHAMETTALEEQMLSASGYGTNELKQIEDHFVRHCGSLEALMNMNQFSSLLVKLGFVPELCQQCYKALLSASDAKGLTLREVQIGLCCLDPSTVHGGLSAQFRCQYIFQFYKGNNDKLFFKEFKQLVKDIYSFKKIPIKEKDLDSAVMDNWKIFSVEESQGISLDTFLNVVGQLKFRGTSVLFRLPHPPVERQNTPKRVGNGKASSSLKSAEVRSMDSSEQIEEEMDTAASISVTAPDGSQANGSLLREFNGSNSLNFSRTTSETSAIEETLSLPDMEYTIATHFVKVKRSGTLTDVTTLWDLVGTDAVSGSLDHLLDVRPGFERLPSINAFDKQSKSNEMLSGLRYFEHALKDNGRGKPKNQFSWGAVDMVSVARCFIQICVKAIDIFLAELRMLEVNSPCYVLGDLHGNFHDLVCFEKVLWRMGPVLTPASFLFLGDYVDRGPHGFEVVAYLFAQKLLMPTKFQLIRGNHEIRAVQEAFTFKQECLEKFGEELGLEVWEAANSAFDAMPVAAIIDKKVFCVHGGIPMPSLEGNGMVTAINDIPSRLSDPVDQSPLAWDMLWNDPIRQDEIDEDIEEQLQDNGFIDNFARGTAHMFSNKALEEFLSRNQLSHVIRAHECKAAGFQIQHQGRLLTVFSSSHYCGATNEAACVLVDDKKIRTIRLDTT